MVQAVRCSPLRRGLGMERDWRRVGDLLLEWEVRLGSVLGW